MSDNKRTIDDDTYADIVIAAKGLGKEIDDLIAQVKEYQAECERQRVEIEKLKADFNKSKEEQKQQITEILEDGLKKMEDDICSAMQEKIEKKPGIDE